MTEEGPLTAFRYILECMNYTAKFNVTLIIVLYVVLVTITSYCFVWLNDRIDDLITNDGNQLDRMPYKLDVWKRQHLLITQFVELINRCFGLLSLIFIAWGFISFLLLSHNTIAWSFDTLNPYKTYFYLHWLTFSNEILHLILVVYVVKKLQSKVKNE